MSTKLYIGRTRGSEQALGGLRCSEKECMGVRRKAVTHGLLSGKIGQLSTFLRQIVDFLWEDKYGSKKIDSEVIDCEQQITAER